MLAVLSFLISTVLSASIPLHSRQSQPSFPPTHGTDFNIHDPSIIRDGDTYYAYGVGKHILIHSASSLSGPWKNIGTVLNQDSKIKKGASDAPWAPSVIHANGKYYCYYSVSESGCRNSALGLATSSSPWEGQWTDHGTIAQSGKGNGSDMLPFDRSNAIDPSVVIDDNRKAYINFGSYWTGIWQVPLSDDLLSLNYEHTSEAKHLASDSPPAGNVPEPLDHDPNGPNPVEGAYISYAEPWYYLWYSYGNCCEFDPNNLPPAGSEYVSLPCADSRLGLIKI